MKKKLLTALLALSLILVLAGCGCEHIWIEANCVNPKTCSECGETEGAPLGHTWLAATCTEAKTCEVCGATEGKAKGHSWTEATCTQAKTCSVCKQTEGEALGHSWKDATTEAPKTCAVCSATEGERIITDSRFTSAAAAPVLGTWRGEVILTGEDIGEEGFQEPIYCVTTFTFGPSGELEASVNLKDPDTFVAQMVKYMEDVLYVSLAEQGYAKEEADEAMQATFGMTVSQYSAKYIEEVDYPTRFKQMIVKKVYYVLDGKIIVGESWDSEMVYYDFSVEGDVISLTNLVQSGKTIPLNRVTE